MSTNSTQQANDLEHRTNAAIMGDYPTVTRATVASLATTPEAIVIDWVESRRIVVNGVAFTYRLASGLVTWMSDWGRLLEFERIGIFSHKFVPHCFNHTDYYYNFPQ